MYAYFLLTAARSFRDGLVYPPVCARAAHISKYTPGLVEKHVRRVEFDDLPGPKHHNPIVV